MLVISLNVAFPWLLYNQCISHICCFMHDVTHHFLFLDIALCVSRLYYFSILYIFQWMLHFENILQWNAHQVACATHCFFILCFPCYIALNFFTSWCGKDVGYYYKVACLLDLLPLIHWLSLLFMAVVRYHKCIN